MLKTDGINFEPECFISAKSSETEKGYIYDIIFGLNTKMDTTHNFSESFSVDIELDPTVVKIKSFIVFACEVFKLNYPEYSFLFYESQTNVLTVVLQNKLKGC